MSIADRIDDAIELAKLDRYEGALLAVLVAIAGTSRRRYPRGIHGAKSDRDAFVSFLDEELWPKTNIQVRGAKGVMAVYVGTEQIRFEDAIYKYYRCALVHEAELPLTVRFEGDALDSRLEIRSGGPNMPLVISRSYFDLFIRVVTEAPENKGEFPMRTLHLLGALCRRGRCSTPEIAAIHGTTNEEVDGFYRSVAALGFCSQDPASGVWTFIPKDTKTYFQLQKGVSEAGIDLRRLLVQVPPANT